MLYGTSSCSPSSTSAVDSPSGCNDPKCDVMQRCEPCDFVMQAAHQYASELTRAGIATDSRDSLTVFESYQARLKTYMEYRPSYPLRELGATFPEIAWLANLPPEERQWHGRFLDRLVERFPNVPEWAWVKLLRKPNGSEHS
jgi:hypothetical protein